MSASDEAQFTQMIDPYVLDILRTATVFIGVSQAEDITQEVLIRAWQSFSTLKDKAAIRSWVLRITMNLCLDWQRGHFGTMQRSTMSLDLASDESLSLADVAMTSPGSSDHSLVLDLRSAIDKLPPHLRMVVVLRYYLDLDANEIGRILRISPSTIRSRLSLAVKHLRKSIIEPEISEGISESRTRGTPGEH